MIEHSHQNTEIGKWGEIKFSHRCIAHDHDPYTKNTNILQR